MPPGVIAGGKNIIVQLVLCQYFRPLKICATFFGICEMHCDKSSGIGFADCTAGLFHQCRDNFPVTFTAEGTVGFVAKLHHGDTNTVIQKGLQSRERILIDQFLLCGSADIFPGFGGHLLGRICPEIRIMEIQHHGHSELSGTVPQNAGGIHIAIAASIAMPF